MTPEVQITLIIVAGVLILFFGVVAVGVWHDRRDRDRDHDNEPRRLTDDPMRPGRRSKDSNQ